MTKHWSKVQQQQREAATLRADIASLESERSELKSQQDELAYKTSAYYRLASAQVDSKLTTKRSQLKAAETPPAPVIQPLPRQTGRAKQWLFLLHMPDLLRSLARSSCLAQQLLLPRPLSAEVQEKVRVQGLQTSLPAHYNRYQADTTYTTPPKTYKGSDGPGAGYVMAMSAQTAPTRFGPDHIDQCHSREDGVWFPDSLAATMAWKGSSCFADAVPSGYFNPFVPVSDQLVVESFTAKLPQTYSTLQWMMYQYGSISETATDRGNLAIASQDDKPDDLSKAAYLALAGLRSFPHRQLHRLCEASLREKELPLDHPAVQLLIQQTLCHLGELGPPSNGTATSTTSSSNTVSQLWRTGWDAPGGVLEALCFELQHLAAELDNKPRDQHSVLLLGWLAAYLSDWHAPCKAVARQFAAMTSRYADQQLQQQIDVLVASGPGEQQLAELKAKQTRWRAMALLCFAAGPLSSAEVGSMLSLMLQIKHGDVYQPDRETAAELADLRVCCHDVMARRLHEVISHLQDQPQLLTAAAASILECLQQQPGGPAPPTLPWQLVHDSSSGTPMASFQAVGSDGHLYSINVLDGTLLFDGNPPGRLPNSVLQHR